ncbi:response regulator [Methylophaga sp.]|jgi:two-component system chemotaxis response regulator CheY|uniref:response regulator n=1 Tax=Methylophaga sp. TaxID=2024840 RepID=UPI001400E8A2|nr:response regulator [Methylophaga sp.]MTI63025.1 response regulator [Methylophaga sp.]
MSLTAADLSILLVEPSAMQLKLIMRHLQQEGISKIDGVSNGEEALSHIAQYPPDLVISAMYLPDMTADELISGVQAIDSNIAFMLISSETGQAALEPIRQAGVMAILPKPFDSSDLRRAIRATLDVIDPSEIELESYDVSELNILLVDDSFTSRNHLSRVLASMGIHNIDLAENGREAVSLLGRHSYDLVVTDLNMPEMDGHELTRYIRDEMGDVVLPILMATTENNQTRLGNVQQAGVSAILDKPFEPQTIREMLFRVLDA